MLRCPPRLYDAKQCQDGRANTSAVNCHTLPPVRPVRAAMSDIATIPPSATRITCTPGMRSASAMAERMAVSESGALCLKSRCWTPSVLPTRASSQPARWSDSLAASVCRSGPYDQGESICRHPSDTPDLFCTCSVIMTSVGGKGDRRFSCIGSLRRRRRALGTACYSADMANGGGLHAGLAWALRTERR